jgi:lipopolysaccharide biosynthesis glycosyltransferase
MKPLWENRLSGKTLGAVENLPVRAGGPVEKEIALLGVQRYFNTGVLLFDLEQWREKGYEEKLLNVDEKILETATLHDQSLPNAVLGGDVAYLDQARKYLTFLPLYDFKRRYPGKMKMAEPGIIHFVGRKP